MRRAGWPVLTRALKEAVAPDSRDTAPSPKPRPRLVAISNSLQPTGLRGTSPLTSQTQPPSQGSPSPSSLLPPHPSPPPCPTPSSPRSSVDFLGVLQRRKHPEVPNQGRLGWGWGGDVNLGLPRRGWRGPPPQPTLLHRPFPPLFPLVTPSPNQA